MTTDIYTIGDLHSLDVAEVMRSSRTGWWSCTCGYTGTGGEAACPHVRTAQGHHYRVIGIRRVEEDESC